MKSFRAEPLNDKIQKLQYHERITFQAPKKLAKNFHNTPHSKALESVCLFRPHDQPIATQSLKEGGGLSKRLFVNLLFFSLEVSGILLHVS